MRTALLLLATSSLATGCIIYDDPVGGVGRGGGGGGGGGVVNVPAGFDDAYALINLGYYEEDDWIQLDASVFDPDDFLDELDVYVEVWDDDFNVLVDTLDLFYANNVSLDVARYNWDYNLLETRLDPRAYDAYSMDFVVLDTFGEGEVLTVFPDFFDGYAYY